MVMDAQHETSIMAYLHFLIYIKENQMRKILFNPRFENVNVIDFEYDRILIKTEDNQLQHISVKKDDELDRMYRNYTSAELRKIHIVDSKLDQSMSKEEIEYMLTNGLGKAEKVNPDDLAALAGYRIEKQIIPL
jgi:hypothetical protein